jgi:hypothetical protein
MIMVIALLAFMFVVMCCMSVLLIQVVGNVRMTAMHGSDGKTDMNVVTYLAVILMIQAGLVGTYITFAFAAIQLGVTTA